MTKQADSAMLAARDRPATIAISPRVLGEVAVRVLLDSFSGALEGEIKLRKPQAELIAAEIVARTLQAALRRAEAGSPTGRFAETSPLGPL